MLLDLAAKTIPDRTLGADDALFGPDAQLDSMELVSLVADVQDAVFEHWQREVVLADERALSRSRSPFRSLSTLAEFVVERIRDGG